MPYVTPTFTVGSLADVSDKVSRRLLRAADEADMVRLQRTMVAREFYKGETPDTLLVRARPNGGTVDDNVRINLAKMIVNKSAAFLVGTLPEVSVEEHTPLDLAAVEAEAQAPPEPPAEPFDPTKPYVPPEPVDQAELEEHDSPAVLKAMEAWSEWSRPEKANVQQRLLAFALNGGMTGTAYYRLYRKEDGDVRMLVLDPSNVTLFTDPDDFETVYAMRVQWTTGERNADDSLYTRRSIIEMDDDAGGWRIIEQESAEAGNKAESWHTLFEEAWPYAWAPIGWCQNMIDPNDVYGLSDLEPDVIGFLLSINAQASNLQRIIRLYAHPHDVITGATAQQIQTSPGGQTSLPDPLARVTRLEMTSDLVGPLGVFDRMRQLLHETTNIPEVASGKLENAGSLSGIALSILYGPLVELTTTKRVTYGPCFQLLVAHVLELLGAWSDELRVELGWGEIVPNDPLAEREVAVLDKELGVSTPTILGGLGYDADKEMGLRSEEDATASEQALREAAAGAATIHANDPQSMPDSTMPPGL